MVYIYSFFTSYLDFVAAYNVSPKDAPAAKPSHADAANATANKGNIYIPPNFNTYSNKQLIC